MRSNNKRPRKKKKKDAELLTMSSSSSASSSTSEEGTELFGADRCNICGKVGSSLHPINTSLVTSAGTYRDAIHAACLPVKVHLLEMKSDVKSVNDIESGGPLAARLLSDEPHSMVWPYRDVLIDEQRTGGDDCEEGIYEMDPFQEEHISVSQHTTLLTRRPVRMVSPEDAHASLLGRAFPRDALQGAPRVAPAMHALVRRKWAQSNADLPLDELTLTLIAEDLSRKAAQLVAEVPPERRPLTGDSVRDLAAAALWHRVSREAVDALLVVPEQPQVRAQCLLDKWRQGRTPHGARFNCPNCGVLMDQTRAENQGCSKACALDLANKNTNIHTRKEAVKLFRKRDIV